MIQKILITGSSNGLGQHLALFFAKKDKTISSLFNVNCLDEDDKKN